MESIWSHFCNLKKLVYSFISPIIALSLVLSACTDNSPNSYSNSESYPDIKFEKEEKKEKEVSADTEDVIDTGIADLGAALLGAALAGPLGAAIIGSYVSYRTADKIMEDKEKEAREGENLLSPFDPNSELTENPWPFSMENIGFYHNDLCNYYHKKAFESNYENIDRAFFINNTINYFNNNGLFLDTNNIETYNTLNLLLDSADARIVIYDNNGSEGLLADLESFSNPIVFTYLNDMLDDIDCAQYWDDVLDICDYYQANAMNLIITQDELDNLLMTIDVAKYSYGLWVANLL